MNLQSTLNKMKSILFAIIAVVTLGAGLAGCAGPVTDPGATKVTGITLNTSALTMEVGSTAQLVGTVTPISAATRTMSWASNNANVTVSAMGLVTAVSPGTSVVTVTSTDGSFKDICTVTVPVPIVLVTGVTLNKNIASILVGSAEQLTATIAPANADNKNVAWSSSSANATVSSTGLVTASVPGSANITVTTEDGFFTAVCAVTVLPISVTGVAVNKTSTSLPLGRTEQLAATIAPANATNKTVTWTSSSANATVTPTGGLVTAISFGSATITATSVDGSFTAACVVTVVPVPVTSVSLNKTSTTLVAGVSEVLVATINPSDAANKAVTWTSSNESIAYVSSGQVMGLAAGSATVTVKTVDGAFTAACLVTVTGALPHTLAEVQPALMVLQAGLTAAAATTNTGAAAYNMVSMTPTITMTCYFHNYTGSGYTLNGNVIVNYNPDYSQGAMNGTVTFTGGLVTEVKYINAYFTFPYSGSVGIKFSDNTSGTMNLATGVFTQN